MNGQPRCYTVGSLCTGICGLDLALHAALGGATRTVWHAEKDPDALRVLQTQCPGVPNLGDITTVDWATVRRPDILTAGFPCQDVSCAGRRSGIQPDRWQLPDGVCEMACGCFPMGHKTWCEAVSPLGWSPAEARDTGAAIAAAAALNERDRTRNPGWRITGNRSGLWSHIAEAVGVLRPPIVLIENVRGLLSARADSDVEPCPWCLGDRGGDDQEPVLRALGAVLGDLSDLGYDAEWVTVAASAVGAPHQRERVFIHAYPADTAGIGYGHTGPALLAGIPAAAVADGAGLRPTPLTSEGRGPGRLDGNRSDTLRAQISLLKTPTAQLAVNGGSQHPEKRRDGGHGPTLADEIEHLLPTPTAVRYGSNKSPSPGAAVRPGLDSISALLPTPLASDGIHGGPHQRRGSNGGDPALSAAVQPELWGRFAEAIARWETVRGPAPQPTERGRTGLRLAPAFVEWMMGFDAGWVTAVPGLSRNAMLRLLGGAVVPQQGAHAIGVLLARRQQAMNGAG